MALALALLPVRTLQTTTGTQLSRSADPPLGPGSYTIQAVPVAQPGQTHKPYCPVIRVLQTAILQVVIILATVAATVAATMEVVLSPASVHPTTESPIPHITVIFGTPKLTPIPCAWAALICLPTPGPPGTGLHPTPSPDSILSPIDENEEEEICALSQRTTKTVGVTVTVTATSEKQSSWSHQQHRKHQHSTPQQKPPVSANPEQDATIAAKGHVAHA